MIQYDPSETVPNYSFVVHRIKSREKVHDLHQIAI